MNSATVNPPDAADSARTAASAAADAGLVEVDPADAGGAELGGCREPVEQAVGDERVIDAVQGGGEPVDHAGEPADDGREVVQHAPAAQRSGVVHDRLEAQHVFAFGVGLQRQVPEVELEQGQVVPRCLDHGGELAATGRGCRCGRGVAWRRTGSAGSARPAGTGCGRRSGRTPGPSARRW